MNRTLLLTVLVALGGAGCAEEQDPASLIEKPRVLGARIDVLDRPGQASPKPGETVTVTWLMAAPGELPPIGWAFALCRARDAAALACGGEPFATVQGHDAPELRLAIPAAETLGDARELVLFGRICAASDPILVETTGEPACTGGGDGTTVSVAIPLQREQGNAHPRFEGPLSFAGMPWATGTACDQLPRVFVGTKDHVIRIETSAADRETYEATLGDPPRPTPVRERLQISQFTTAGELNRSFSFVEADDPSDAPTVEMKWDAPLAKDVPAAGMLVRFTFVARDLRGGLAATTRAVCVTN